MGVNSRLRAGGRKKEESMFGGATGNAFPEAGKRLFKFPYRHPAIPSFGVSFSFYQIQLC